MVWVGFDDNQPLGLSGSQAALPIWTEFMKAALAGPAERVSSRCPTGITFVEIDRDTGKLATPDCPRTFTESFIAGTEPIEYCPLHSCSRNHVVRTRWRSPAGVNSARTVPSITPDVPTSGTGR